MVLPFQVGWCILSVGGVSIGEVTAASVGGKFIARVNTLLEAITRCLHVRDALFIYMHYSIQLAHINSSSNIYGGSRWCVALANLHFIRVFPIFLDPMFSPVLHFPCMVL